MGTFVVCQSSSKLLLLRGTVVILLCRHTQHWSVGVCIMLSATYVFFCHDVSVKPGSNNATLNDSALSAGAVSPQR